jgi:hypothetical protein
MGIRYDPEKKYADRQGKLIGDTMAVTAIA